MIPQHNENAYSKIWPNSIGFLCLLPSQTGGATAISDSRYIY
ncbi:TauD/TfdA family dioxygenase [Colwellia psychrerythraea]